MERAEILDVLRATQWLREIDEPVLEALAEHVLERRYAAGEPIFAEGDPGDAVYVIVEGAVRIHVTVDLGGGEHQDLTLDTLGPRRDFGTLALLDGGPRSAGAAAAEPTLALVLPRDDILPILQQEWVTAEQLLRGLTTIIRRMNRRLANVAYLDVPGLVAQAIEAFNERYGQDDEGRWRIEHPITFEELAAEAGLLPKEVEAVISQWELDRVLERDPGRWVILQPWVIKRWARTYRRPPSGDDEGAGGAAPGRRPERLSSSPEDKLEALRASPILQDLDAAALRQLADKATPGVAAAGERIFGEDDDGFRLYLLRKGEVRIHMSSPTGADLTLARIRPPQAFGELTLLDGRPRSATATAEAPSEFLWLHRDDFVGLLRSEPAAVDAVMRSLAHLVRVMNTKLGDVALLDRRARVCQAILAFVELYGAETDEGVYIHHPMSAQDLASAAGLYAVEVERILTILSYDHYLERRIDGWLVRDIDYIERCARSYR